MAIEQEIKLVIPDLKAYSRLQGLLPPPISTSIQINYYLDSKALILASSRSMLRIRHEDATLKLTYKQQLTPDLSNHMRCLELETELPIRCLNQLEEGVVPDELKSLPPVQAAFKGKPEEIQIIGSLRNERSYHPWNGLTAELDKTSFSPLRTDLEMEVETDTPTQIMPKLKLLLTQADIPLIIQRKPKYQRFLEHHGYKK